MMLGSREARAGCADVASNSRQAVTWTGRIKATVGFGQLAVVVTLALCCNHAIAQPDVAPPTEVDNSEASQLRSEPKQLPAPSAAEAVDENENENEDRASHSKKPARQSPEGDQAAGPERGRPEHDEEETLAAKPSKSANGRNVLLPSFLTRRPTWPGYKAPTPAAQDAIAEALQSVQRLVPTVPESLRDNAAPLLVLLLLSLIGIAGVQRVRARLDSRGWLPKLFTYAHAALRVGALFLLLAFAAALLPEWLGPVLPFVLIAAAAAAGWSTRDILPDVIAGLVIAFERRIRTGAHLAGPDFSGTVESIGLRAAYLRDGKGHTVTVPNRRLLAAPLISNSAFGAAAEVSLRFATSHPSLMIRSAIQDAVLMCPWLPAGAKPTVLNDARDPTLWHVRCRLLHAMAAVQFEGELYERTEEVLRQVEHQRAREGNLSPPAPGGYPAATTDS